MLSSHDPRLLIGFGPVEEAESLVIRWPSGAVSTFENVTSGTTLDVREPEADDDPAATPSTVADPD